MHILVSLGLAALTLVSLPAQASHSMKYGGGQCSAWGGAMTLSSNRAQNASTTTTASLDCPAVKDGTTINGASSFVDVIDNNSTSGEHVGCSLIAYYMSGATLYPSYNTQSTSALGSTFSSDRVQTLTFSGTLGSASAKWYYLTCGVPKVGAGYSYIVDYSIDES